MVERSLVWSYGYLVRVERSKQRSKERTTGRKDWTMHILVRGMFSNRLFSACLLGVEA